MTRIATEPKLHFSHGWGAKWLRVLMEGAISQSAEGKRTYHSCQSNTES